MSEESCCAILGHTPMRFAWGFDEENEKCHELKIELLQLIMEIRQQNVLQFIVVCDCGIGLYAGEIVNLLRESDKEIRLYCVTPHEEQSTKWAPYLRERYFDLLEKCTFMEVASPQKTPVSQQAAYMKIIDHANVIIAVYDPTSARNDAIDRAICYAVHQNKDIIYLHPDTFKRSVGMNNK